ncbi:hypothetical protein BESB_063030 [Besnoitia besnoiti]|uniref:Uncharacterized protein n=1 Tax=Besnoitia besnoiti TaxID=94643 RepID=A0A2A9MHI7_BESBE|nr:hypothetical protein BESB_063030 [Besnoitia besnoiti]PFH35416.1 hypothetical protein BESB_063030 [Besnoitia besnoiti]
MHKTRPRAARGRIHAAERDCATIDEDARREAKLATLRKSKRRKAMDESEEYELETSEKKTHLQGRMPERTHRKRKVGGRKGGGRRKSEREKRDVGVPRPGATLRLKKTPHREEMRQTKLQTKQVLAFGARKRNRHSTQEADDPRRQRVCSLATRSSCLLSSCSSFLFFIASPLRLVKLALCALFSLFVARILFGLESPVGGGCAFCTAADLALKVERQEAGSNRGQQRVHVQQRERLRAEGERAKRAKEAEEKAPLRDSQQETEEASRRPRVT